jgi:hypothetical protein
MVDLVLRLSPDERNDWTATVAQLPDPGFLQTVRAKLLHLYQTAPKGVGAGPSGERYEHLRAAPQSALGCEL